jgi:hypothetical protein
LKRDSARFMVRGPISLLIALIVAAHFLQMQACVPACDEAVDYCYSCDLESSTCAERFSAASPSVCEHAVARYQERGCAPEQPDCHDQPSP